MLNPALGSGKAERQSRSVGFSSVAETVTTVLLPLRSARGYGAPKSVLGLP